MCKDLEPTRLRVFTGKILQQKKEKKSDFNTNISVKALHTPQPRQFTFNSSTHNTDILFLLILLFLKCVPFLFLYFLRTIRHICMGIEEVPPISSTTRCYFVFVMEHVKGICAVSLFILQSVDGVS